MPGLQFAHVIRAQTSEAVPATAPRWSWIFGARADLTIALCWIPIFAFAHVLTTTGSSTGDAFGLAIVGFGTRIPIALALGWVFLRRRTVWASFGLHAAFNAILLVLAEVASRSL